MPSSDSPFAALGSNKSPKPVYLAPKLNKPLISLGVETLGDIGRLSREAQQRFDLGTPRQEQLLGQQAGLTQDLLARARNFDPNQYLRDIGTTAFSFINPNVVEPLARSDVNAYELARRARGLNPAAIDSTAERLRNARIASGRYYDVANRVYGILPQLYNQGITSQMAYDQLARGYLPELMGQYRALDLSPLQIAQARAGLVGLGAGNVGDVNEALRSGVYGYQQPRNFWDRAGQFESGLWSRVKDAAQIYASLYGGGMLGGGGGGGLSQSYVQPQFNAAPGGYGYSPQFYTSGPQ